MAARYLTTAGGIRFKVPSPKQLVVAVIAGLMLAIPIYVRLQPVHAATVTWNGNGTDGTCGGAAGSGNNWSCGANWSTGTAPTSADIATFNATSVKNVTIDASINVAGISIASTYTGTITQATGVTMTIGTSNYSQAGGTFSGGNSTITDNGSFSVTGGTFTSTSGTLSVVGAFTNSATFNHNGGTLSYATSSSTTFTTGGTTFNNLTFAEIGFGNTITLADSFTVAGDLSDTTSALGGVGNPGTAKTITVQGNVTIASSSSDTFGGSNLTVNMTGASKTFAISAGVWASKLTLSGSSPSITQTGGTIGSTSTVTVAGTTNTATATTNLTVGNLTINSGNTLDVGLHNLSVAGNFSNSGTYTNSGTTTLNGSTSQTLTSGGATFSALTLANTSGGVTLADSFTVSGTLTFSGSAGVANPATSKTITAQGNVSVSSGTVGGTNLTVNMTGTSPSFSQSGGTYSSNLTFSGSGETFSQSSGSFAATGTLTVAGTTNTLSASTAMSVGIVVINSGNTLALGTTAFTAGGNVTNNGTISGTSTATATWTFNGSLTNASGATFSGTKGAISVSGAVSNSGTFSGTAGATNAWTFGSSLTNASGASFTGTSGAISVTGTLTNAGTFTSTTATLTVGGDFTNTGGTFTHNSGTVSLSASGGTTRTLTSAGTTFNNLTLNPATGGPPTTLSLADSFTVAGTLTFAGSGSGANVNNPGSAVTITAQGNVAVTGTFNQTYGGTNLTVDMTGTGTSFTQSGGVSTVAFASNLKFDGSGQTLTQTTDTITTGTVTIGGTGNTVTATTAVLLNALVINSGDTLDMGTAHNLTASGAVTDNGTLSGTGTFSVAGSLTVGASAVDSMGTTSLNGSSVQALTTNGYTFPGAFTFANTSGGVTLADSFTVSGTLTSSGSAGVNNPATAKTITAAGGVSISSGTFGGANLTVTMTGSTVTFAQSGGTWAAVTNFNGGGVSMSQSSGTFTGAATINGTSQTVTCTTAFTFGSSLTISSGETLDMGTAHNLTVSGNFSNNNGTVTGTGTGSFLGSFTHGATAVDTLGTTSLAGTTAQTFTTNNYAFPNNLTFANISGGVTLADSFTVGGGLTMSGGGGVGNPAAGKTITAQGNVTASGGTIGGANLVINMNGTSKTFLLSGSTFASKLNFLGASTTLTQTAGTFNSSSVVTVSSAGITVTASTAVSFGNTLTINAGDTLSLGSNALTVTGAFTNNGTLSGTAAATATWTFSSSLANNSGATFTGTAGSVSVAGTLTNAGTFTSTSGTLTFNADFTNTGTFSANGGTVTMSTSGGTTRTLTSGGATFNNLTLSPNAGAPGAAAALADSFTVAGTLLFSGSYTLNNPGSAVVITAQGNVTVSLTNPGVSVGGSNLTVNMTGTGKTFSETFGIFASNVNFQGSSTTISQSGGSISSPSVLTVAGTGHTVTAGTNFSAYQMVVSSGDTLAMGTHTLTTSSSFTNNDGTLSGSSTASVGGNFTTSAGGTVSIATVILNGSSAQTLTTNGYAFPNNLTFANTSGGVNVADNVTVGGTLTSSGSAGVNNPATAKTVTAQGSVSVSSGTFGGTNLTVTMTGSGTTYTQTGGTFAADLNLQGTTMSVSQNGGTFSSTNLTTLSGTGQTVTATGSFSPYALTINSGDALAMASQTLTVQGAFTNNGTLGGTSSATATWTFSGTFSNNSGATFTGTAGSIAMAGAFTNAGTFTSTSGTLTFNLDFTNSGTFNHNGGTVTDAPTAGANRTLTSGGAIFNNLNLNPTAGAPGASIVLADNFTVSGNLGLGGNASTITNPATAKTITVNGNLALTGNSITYGGNNLTIAMAGSGSQSISNSGTSTSSAFNLSITNTAAPVQLTTAFSMSTTGQRLTIGSGAIFYLNGNNLTFNGTSSVYTNNGTMRLQGIETMPTDTAEGTVEYVGRNVSESLTIDDFGTNDYYNLSINDTHASKATFQAAAALKVLGAFTVASGTYSSNGQTTNVTGLTTVSGGTYTAGTATQTLSGGLTVSGGTYAANATGATTASGTLTVSGGTFTGAAGTVNAVNVAVSSGTLTAPSGTLNVSGNWTDSGGTFNHNSGTVIFNGNDQTLSGATTFNNFAKSVTASHTLTFPAGLGNTQTFVGTLTLQGTSGQLLLIRSSTPGTQARIDPQGTRSVNFVNVQDSNNISALTIAPATWTSLGNNTNWGNPPTVTGLGPANLLSGSYVRTNAPGPLTFTVSDPDNTETEQYQVQIATDQNYQSIVLDYSSVTGLAQGSMSFTIGQAAGGGTYNVGDATTRLADGTYYWQVRAINSHLVQSNYTSASGGALAFIVDTTAPAAPTVSGPSSAVVTNGTSYAISGTAEANALVQVYRGVTVIASQQLSGGATSFSIPVSLTTNGVNTLNVTATDAAGNESTAAAVPAITEDTTAPSTPSISSPTSGATLASATPSIQASSYSDNLTSQSAAEWLIATNAGFSPVQTDTGDDAAHLTSYTPAALSDGTYYAKVRYKDAAGNYSAYSSAISFTVDTTPPAAPEVTSPSGAVLTNASTYAVAGTAEANALVTVKRGTTVLGTKQLTGGATAFSVNVALVSNSANSLSVTAADAVGNVSSAAAVPTITEDNTAPSTPVITRPSSGTLTAQASVSVKASDYVDAMSAQAAAQWVLATDSGFSHVVSDSGDDTSNLGSLTVTPGDGTYYAKVRYKDAAGNYSAYSATVSVTIDTTAPAAPAVTSPSGPVTTSDTSYVIAGTAEAGAYVRIKRGDVAVGTQQLGAEATAFSIGVSLQDGANSLTADATDAAGNTSSAAAVPTITLSAGTIGTTGGGSAPTPTPTAGPTSGPTSSPTATATAGSGPSASPTSGTGSPASDVTPPANPSSLAIVQLDGQLRLSWQNPSDPDFQTVRVYRSLSSGRGLAVAELPKTQRGYLDIGLTNDTTYYYVLTAVDAAGNESSGTLPLPGTPRALASYQSADVPTVTGLTAAPGSHSISFSFDPVPSGTTVLVFRSADPNSQGDQVGSTSGTSFTDTSLDADHRYYYTFVVKRDSDSKQSPPAVLGAKTLTDDRPAVVQAASGVLDRLRQQPFFQPPAAVAQNLEKVAQGTAIGVGVTAVATPVITSVLTVLLDSSSPSHTLISIFYLGRRRKRRAWGRVYSASNRLPLSGASIGLVPTELYRGIPQTVSDPTGAYSFFLKEPGTYQLAVTAPGFASFTDKAEPYQLQAPRRERSIYLSEERAVPVRHRYGRLVTALAAILKWLNNLSLPLFVLGLLLSVYDVVANPSNFTEFVLALYAAVLVVELIALRRVALTGYVEKGDAGEEGVTVRAYRIGRDEEKSLAATTLTDRRGAYSLHLKPGRYVFAYSKSGFETVTTDEVRLRRGRQEAPAVGLRPYSYTEGV